MERIITCFKFISSKLESGRVSGAVIGRGVAVPASRALRGEAN